MSLLMAPSAAVFGGMDDILMWIAPTGSTVATIKVGDYFVEQIKQGRLARQVLAVDHELYPNQQKRGETPEKNLEGTAEATSDEREFLAYYRTATTEAPVGVGDYGHSERLSVIRGGIGGPPEVVRRQVRHPGAGADQLHQGTGLTGGHVRLRRSRGVVTREGQARPVGIR